MMGRRPLLTKQQVHVALQRFTASHGRAPSAEELRRELRIGSTRTVFRYLQMLEDEGAIARRQGAPGVKLLRPRSAGLQTRGVPIVGQVPAGNPMLAEENITGWIRLPKALASPASDGFFLLQVRGTSMNKAAVAGDIIDDGDLVLVRQQTTARHGDIVVAMIDGEATVKRFAIAPGYFVLQPVSSDRHHRPIMVEADFRVLGKVTRVLKKGSEMVHTIFEENEGA